VDRLAHVSSKFCMCSISSYAPVNQNVHSPVSSNDHYQENGFAVDVLTLVMPKFEIGLLLRRADANRCCIFNAQWLGNGLYMARGAQRVQRRYQVATIILSSRHTKNLELWMCCCYATGIAMATDPPKQNSSIAKFDCSKFQTNWLTYPACAQISSKLHDFCLASAHWYAILIQHCYPFVWLSVRHTPVFYGNGLTYCHNFFTTR